MRWLPLILIGILVYIESVIFVRVASEVGVLMTLILMRLIPHIRFYQPGNGFGQTGGGKYQNGDTFEGEFQRKQDDPSFTIDNSDKTDSSDKDDRPKS